MLQEYPIRRYDGSNQNISPGGLTNYLLDRCYYRGHPNDLPGFFDLSDYKPTFEWVYQNAKLGFVLPPDQRSQYLQQAAKMRNSRFGSDFADLVEGIANNQALVERSTTVYYDTKSQKSEIAPITFGEYTKTTVPTTDIFFNDDIPIVEIHTHPSNSLFSPLDYSRILFDAFGDGTTRILRGAILLCPDVQVLALATTESPIMGGEQIDKWVAERKALYDLDSYPSIRRLKSKFEELTDKIQAELVKINEDMVERVRQREAGGEFNNLSSDEIRQLQKRFKDDHKAELDRKLARYKVPHMQVRVDLQQEMNLKSNNADVQIARDAGVKLYSATNMQHFSAFNA